MKKNLVLLFSFLLFLLVGCGNESELEGTKIGMTSHDPTSNEEEINNKDFKFTSNMLVFDFTSSDEVTLMNKGNEYSGKYTLEDNTLTVNLEDKGNTLRLVFSDFQETPDKYYSYTAKIKTGELDTSDEISQLSNITNNISVGAPYIFLEE